jgi:hypothetical protein
VTEAIPVDAATVREALTGLPLMARLTLSFAARLRRGTLEVRLPTAAACASVASSQVQPR